jgi:hypothetical protein
MCRWRKDGRRRPNLALALASLVFMVLVALATSMLGTSSRDQEVRIPPPPTSSVGLQLSHPGNWAPWATTTASQIATSNGGRVTSLS